jgi:hypothetical protein
MNVLEIPEQLKGLWDHLLIMTYGADLSFFERTLWPQLAGRCRNKIILADGQHYLEACALYARKEGLVNHLNQSYVAAGIFGPRRAHAKLILLTSAEQGRLLVGSGNLGWQGYASGGEMFTLYEYSATHNKALPAFLAVHELVDGLTYSHYLNATVERRLERIWEQTPWLFQPAVSSERPVRHNLTQSFLDQLQREVNGDPVEELWVLTPFYDREALALAQLLKVIQPQRAMLLLQEGKTSVDPEALQRVVDAASCPCEIRAFHFGGDNSYVHAKYYLLKLADRALCLQGSPNLSQVAFLFHVPQGNVEIANLLTGSRDAFDGLLDALKIDTAPTRPTLLKLAYQDQPATDNVSDETWRLTGGIWQERQLVLHFQGKLPDLQNGKLVIAHNVFPLHVCKQEAQALELGLLDGAATLLSRPVPLLIRWHSSSEMQESNPIFVYNQAALNMALEASAEGEKLDHVGDLDLDDKEIEELLGNLSETLIVDRRSVWQLANCNVPSSLEEKDDALHLDYADIDYEKLRHHPKIQQYLFEAKKGRGYARSRLQIILASIAAHFRQYQPASATLIGSTDTDLEEEDIPISESAQASDERQGHNWSAQKRIGRMVKRFVVRYLHGLRSREFQEFVGSEVITKNYLIFTHLLWKFLAKDWVELEFVLDAFSETWSLFWGNEQRPGYFYQLPLEEQLQALQQLEEYSNDSVLLAAFYFGARATYGHRERYLLMLRDCWRAFLCKSPFPLLPSLLMNAQHLLSQLLPYDPPSAIQIVDQLASLAQFETRANFLRNLETSGHYPVDSFAFVKETIARGSVDCLRVRVPEVLATKEASVILLQEWMLIERLDYYRIAAEKHGNVPAPVIFYEASQQRGKYWSREPGSQPQNLGAISLPKRAWDSPLAQLRVLATRMSSNVTLE